MKNVIDADNNDVIRRFLKSNTKEVLKSYQEDDRWEDVSLDCDGDIILWKKL